MIEACRNSHGAYGQVEMQPSARLWGQEGVRSEDHSEMILTEHLPRIEFVEKGGGKDKRLAI